MHETEELFLSAQEPTSGRWAILEDDGTSAWLYVTEPDSRKPVADCLVYSRVAPVSDAELKAHRGGPPPISARFSSAEAVVDAPSGAAIELTWTPDGRAAVVTINSELWAKVVVAEGRGSSRAISRSGPFGDPLAPRGAATD